MILIIDNYDSFVYNLYQYVGELGFEVCVRRNDVTAAEARKLAPEKIIISPGPGRPESAGNCVEIIKELCEDAPILGVCLGHQCIGVTFGAKVSRAQVIMHGKTSEVEHDGEGVYKGLGNPLVATRYHSLAIEEDSVDGSGLLVSARSRGDGIVMGVRHAEHEVEGVQFHPESILTVEGKKMLKNFLETRE